MRCSPRASNGPDHLGLCALQAKPTYKFDRTEWAPDAMFIDLGTNDMRAITSLDKIKNGRCPLHTCQHTCAAVATPSRELLYHPPH